MNLVDENLKDEIEVAVADFFRTVASGHVCHAYGIRWNDSDPSSLSKLLDMEETYFEELLVTLRWVKPSRTGRNEARQSVRPTVYLQEYAYNANER